MSDSDLIEERIEVVSQGRAARYRDTLEKYSKSVESENAKMSKSSFSVQSNALKDVSYQAMKHKETRDSTSPSSSRKIIERKIVVQNGVHCPKISTNTRESSNDRKMQKSVQRDYEMKTDKNAQLFQDSLRDSYNKTKSSFRSDTSMNKNNKSKNEADSYYKDLHSKSKKDIEKFANSLRDFDDNKYEAKNILKSNEQPRVSNRYQSRRSELDLAAAPKRQFENFVQSLRSSDDFTQKSKSPTKPRKFSPKSSAKVADQRAVKTSPTLTKTSLSSAESPRKVKSVKTNSSKLVNSKYDSSKQNNVKYDTMKETHLNCDSGRAKNVHKDEYRKLEKYITEKNDKGDIVILEKDEEMEDESGNLVKVKVQTRKKKDGSGLVSRRVATSTKTVDKESEIEDILLGNPEHEIVNRKVSEREENDGSKVKIITEIRRRPDGIEYKAKNVTKTSKIYEYDSSEEVEYCEDDELIDVEETTEISEDSTIYKTVIETRRKENGLEYQAKKIFQVGITINAAEDDEILDMREVEEIQKDGTQIKFVLEKRKTKDNVEYIKRLTKKSRKMTLSEIQVSEGKPKYNENDKILTKCERDEIDDEGNKITVVQETRMRKDGSTYSFDHVQRRMKGKEEDVKEIPMNLSLNSKVKCDEDDEVIKEEIVEEIKPDGTIVRTIVQRRRNKQGMEYLRHLIVTIPKLPDPELQVGSLDDEVLEEDYKENVLDDGTQFRSKVQRRRSSTTGANYTLRKISKVFQNQSTTPGLDEVIDENVMEEEGNDGIVIKTVIRRYQTVDGKIYTTHDVQKLYKQPMHINLEDSKDKIIDRTTKDQETDDGYIIRTMMETKCQPNGTHYTIEKTEKVKKDTIIESNTSDVSLLSGSPDDKIVNYTEHEEPYDDTTVIKTITEVRRKVNGKEYTVKTTIKSTKILIPEHETSYVVIMPDSNAAAESQLLPSPDDEVIFTRRRKEVDKSGKEIMILIETRKSNVTGEKYNLTKRIHTTDVVMTPDGEKVITFQSGDVKNKIKKFESSADASKSKPKFERTSKKMVQSHNENITVPRKKSTEKRATHARAEKINISGEIRDSAFRSKERKQLSRRPVSDINKENISAVNQEQFKTSSSKQSSTKFSADKKSTMPDQKLLTESIELVNNEPKLSPKARVTIDNSMPLEISPKPSNKNSLRKEQKLEERKVIKEKTPEKNLFAGRSDEQRTKKDLAYPKTCGRSHDSRIQQRKVSPPILKKTSMDETDNTISKRSDNVVAKHTVQECKRGKSPPKEINLTSRVRKFSDEKQEIKRKNSLTKNLAAQGTTPYSQSKNIYNVSPKKLSSDDKNIKHQKNKKTSEENITEKCESKRTPESHQPIENRVEESLSDKEFAKIETEVSQTPPNTHNEILVPVEEPLCIRKYIHVLGKGDASSSQGTTPERKISDDSLEEKLTSTQLVKKAMTNPVSTENKFRKTSDEIKTEKETNVKRNKNTTEFNIRKTSKDDLECVKIERPSNSSSKTEPKELPEYLKDIESICDIAILDSLLIKAQSYDERRIIRSRIRVLKKTDTNFNKKTKTLVSTSLHDPSSKGPYGHVPARKSGISHGPVRKLFEEDTKPFQRKKSTEFIRKKSTESIKKSSYEKETHSRSQFSPVKEVMQRKHSRGSQERETISGITSEKPSRVSPINVISSPSARTEKSFKSEKERKISFEKESTAQLDTRRKSKEFIKKQSTEKIPKTSSSRKPSRQESRTSPISPCRKRSTEQRSRSNTPEENKITRSKSPDTKTNIISKTLEPVRSKTPELEALKISPETDTSKNKTQDAKTNLIRKPLEPVVLTTKTLEEDAEILSSSAFNKSHSDFKTEKKFVEKKKEENDVEDNFTQRKQSAEERICTRLNEESRNYRKISDENKKHKKLFEDIPSIEYTKMTKYTLPAEERIVQQNTMIIDEVKTNKQDTKNLVETKEVHKYELEVDNKDQFDTTQYIHYDDYHTVTHQKNLKPEQVQCPKQPPTELKSAMKKTSQPEKEKLEENIKPIQVSDVEESHQTYIEKYDDECSAISSTLDFRNEQNLATKISSVNGYNGHYQEQEVHDTGVFLEPLRHQIGQTQLSKSQQSDVDKVISSYGVGPTDENGLPLFGLKALKKKTKNYDYNQSNENLSYDKQTRSCFKSSTPMRYQEETPASETYQNKTNNSHLVYDEPVSSSFETKTKEIQQVSSSSFETENIQKVSSTLKTEETQQEINETRVSNTFETKETQEVSSNFETDIKETQFSKTYDSEIKETQPAYDVKRLSTFETRKSKFESDKFSDIKINDRVSSSKTTADDIPMFQVQQNESRSFLDDKSKVTGIADVVNRMGATEKVNVNGVSAEDLQAKSILNKFLGSQVLLTGVESMLQSDSADMRTSETSENSEIKETKKEESFHHEIYHDDFRTTLDPISHHDDHRSFRNRVKVFNKSEQETCDGGQSDSIGEINIFETTNVQELHKLLDTCSDFEERKRIRKRIEDAQVENTEFAKEESYSYNYTREATVDDKSKLEKSESFASSKKLNRTNGADDALFQLSNSVMKNACSAKELILTWCQCRTRGYEGVKIENFSTSWNDGLAFCALVHHFFPDAFDYNELLTKKNKRHNFNLAFSVADERAEVMPLLDVEDMVVMRKPDWKCVFTYVQSLYNKFRDM